MKNSVYFDTTILSYLYDERESLKPFKDITFDWWNTQRKNYSLFLSVETLTELNAGDYPNKETIIKAAQTIEILPRIKEIEEVAQGKRI